MKALIGYFSKTHLFANLLTFLIFVFGIYALSNIQRDIFPNVNYHITTIYTSLPGASPEQVERLIINNIEPELRELDGLDSVQSTATEGLGVIVVRLDPDAKDPDKTNRDIQRAVEQAEDLPSAATKPKITFFESAAMGVIEVNISGSSNETLVRRTSKTIADELSAIDEVGQTTKSGYKRREYIVEANPFALARRQVSINQIIQTLKNRNISLPAGGLENDQGIESLVRTDSQYQSVTEIANTVVVSNVSGYKTRIRDVAKVYEGYEDPASIYRINGRNSISIKVTKKKNADALTLVQKIKKRMKEITPILDESINISYSNDFSIYLSRRLSVLGSNLFVGLLLVILILSLFLPWQVNLVVSAGIPVALLATLGIAYLSGITINLISLVGLIIVLGMLVDDAIVVSENIWRHIERGGDKTAAIVNGSAEVFVPILGSILTTVSAFAPMLFMTGVFGGFIFDIPLMVILALTVSVFEAFLIMPSHFGSWVLPFLPQGESAYKPKITKFSAWFNRLRDKYVRYVKWSLNYRYLLLVGCVLIFVIAVVAQVKFGRVVLFPSEGSDIFHVRLETPMGTSLDRNTEIVKAIEQKVFSLPAAEVADVFTSVGVAQNDSQDPRGKRGTNFANIRVALTPSSGRKRTLSMIADDVKKKIGKPKDIKKITISVERRGPPQGTAVSISIKGEKLEVLENLANQIEDELQKIKGVKDIENSFVLGKREWKVRPQAAAVSASGLTAIDISQAVRASFAGIVATSVQKLDEAIDIRVKQKQISSDVKKQLDQIRIGNRSGRLIPLRTVAKITNEPSLNQIQHSEYKRVITISANVNVKEITAIEANKSIKPFIYDLLKKNPGYTAEFEGEEKDTNDSLKSLGQSFIFSAMIIFFLLVLMFENFLQPLLVLSSIPLGFIGVILALSIHNQPMSFMGMLGMLALAGVIVNNGIVFIDFVNKLRKQGVELKDSIVQAAGIRFRPIVLTTVTTVSGLIPTAYGAFFEKVFNFGGSDPFIVPIALSLGWGLAFGSTIIVLALPSFVAIVDDIRSVGTRIKNRIFKVARP